MKTYFSILLILGTCLAQDVTNPTTGAPETTPAPTPDHTTAPAPPVTTHAPDTTTTAPKPDYSRYFTLKEDGVPCIMVTGDFRATVQYTDSKQESKKAALKVPVPSPDVNNVTVTGSCRNADNTSSITLTFGEHHSNNFTLHFNQTSEAKYELTDVELYYKINSQDFPDSSDEGAMFYANGTLPGLSHVQVSVNQSLSCRALVQSSAFSGNVEHSNVTYTTTATALGYKLEAFNSNPSKGDELQEGIQCSQDDTSDLVPLAVGCALAGLVLIVLIAYLVGRRNRASAYQSV